MEIFDPRASDLDGELRDLRVRLLVALAFIAVVSLVGTVGFRIVDPTAGWVRAFFMTVITLTTVGYGHEVAVETDGARIFTVVLILAGMGGVLYFVSTTTAFFIEGQIGQVFRRRRMQKHLAGLQGHMIVCGSGPTMRYVAQELVRVERELAVVVPDASEAELLQGAMPDAPILVGDATDDQVLRSAGAERAAGLVACTDSDKDNLVISLSARQLNPSLRIVSRTQDVEASEKMRKVGADAVVSPDFIGGLRLASELIRPTVVTFLDTMLRDRDANLRIEEVAIREGSRAVGATLGDLDLASVGGALLVAVRRADDSWTYNPPPDLRVDAGTVLIFLGSPDDARALREHLAPGDPRPVAGG